MSRRKWRVRRFVLGVLQRFRTKRIRKMVVLQERLRSQAERTYVERVQRKFKLEKEENDERRWYIRSQKLLRDLQMRYLDRYVECKARWSVELLKMLLCTTFPRRRDVLTSCTSERIAIALNDISFEISDQALTCLVRYLNVLGHGENDETEDEEELKSAVEFETPTFDLVLVAQTIEGVSTSEATSSSKKALATLIRIACEIAKRFRDESQLMRWAVRLFSLSLS